MPQDFRQHATSLWVTQDEHWMLLDLIRLRFANIPSMEQSALLPLRSLPTCLRSLSLLLLPLPTLLSTPISLQALPLFALLDQLTDVVCSPFSLADCYQPFRSLRTPKSSRSDALNSIDATTISRLTAPHSAHEPLYRSPISRNPS